jgi:hypothetical protein
MGQSDNLDEPVASEAQRDNRVRPATSTRSGITSVRLPPDLLETWWERVLAIVVVGLVVWTIVDIVRYGP